MLAKEKVAEYKARLESEKGKLLEEVKKHDKPDDMGNDVDDIDAIEAQEAEEFGTKLSISQVLRDRLEEIEESLAHMGKGTYGVCTKCKKSISEEVLDIVPESMLCADCKRSNLE